MSLNEIEDYDLLVQIRKNSCVFGQVYVKYRPLAFEFINFVADKFELVIFCAGSPAYCEPVLDAVERDKKYFAHRIYSEHVLFQNANFPVKYYDFLFSCGRSKDDTIIVESDVATYCLNMFNGVPICPYKNVRTDVYDTELAYLARCLDELRKASSVSETIAAYIRDAALSQADYSVSEDKDDSSSEQGSMSLNTE